MFSWYQIFESWLISFNIILFTLKENDGSTDHIGRISLEKDISAVAYAIIGEHQWGVEAID